MKSCQTQRREIHMTDMVYKALKKAEVDQVSQQLLKLRNHSSLEKFC
jgi:hypothetical protein